MGRRRLPMGGRRATVDSRAESLGLAGSVTTILRDLLHERLGLSYQADQFTYVADRLAALVIARGFGSFMDYYYLLKYDNDPDEWLRVMDALSVQETYFWREIDQLRAVVDVVVPMLAASMADKGRGAPLRIWSVPCATGEEPLTIAMLLEEAGWFGRLPIEIVGSDASPSAIAKAQAGRYGERAFRNLPPALRERYFTSVAPVPAKALSRESVVDPKLHARVRYDLVNVMDGAAVASHATAPIVFCRNLFIYFSEQSIRRACQAFAAAMPRPGYLCLGASESLLRYATSFDLRELGGAFIYVLDAPRARTGADVTAPERTTV
jgi:chemotaxis protein methyltransferase CheR